METNIGDNGSIVREDPSDLLHNAVDRFPQSALWVDLSQISLICLTIVSPLNILFMTIHDQIMLIATKSVRGFQNLTEAGKAEFNDDMLEREEADE